GLYSTKLFSIAPGSTVVILPSLILKFSPSVLPVGGLYVSDVVTSRRSRCFLVGSLPTYVYLYVTSYVPIGPKASVCFFSHDSLGAFAASGMMLKVGSAI